MPGTRNNKQGTALGSSYNRMEDGGRDTSQYGVIKHVEMNIQEECISFNSAESKATNRSGKSRCEGVWGHSSDAGALGLWSWSGKGGSGYVGDRLFHFPELHGPESTPANTRVSILQKTEFLFI